MASTTPMVPPEPPTTVEADTAHLADDTLSNPASIREDQISSATAFLTHPKVRDSSIASKRSFLERKGLTEPEIEEAFRRVPEPISVAVAGTATQPSPSIVGSGLVTYQNQAAIAQRPAAGPHVNGAAPAHGYQQNMVPAGQPGSLALAPQPPAPEPVRWTQVVLGVGVVAASVYAVRALLLPYAQEWWHAWNERSRQQREQQELQAAAMKDIVDALKACQSELMASSKTMTQLTASIAEQQSQFIASAKSSQLVAEKQGAMLQNELSDLRALLLEQQQQQYFNEGADRGASNGQSMSGNNWLRERGAAAPSWASPVSSNPATLPGQRAGAPVTLSQGQDWFASSGGNVYPGGSTSIQPPPRGYLGGVGTAAKGETNGARPGMASGHGTTPSPSARLGAGGATYPGERTSPALPSREPGYLASSGSSQGDGPAAMWAAAAKSAEVPTVVSNGDQLRPSAAATGSADTGAGHKAEETAPYPPSFNEVMAMVSKGLTPPNVRTDIVDTPPDPTRPLPEPRGPPQPKPWERAASQQLTSEQQDHEAGAEHGRAALNPDASPWAPPWRVQPGAGSDGSRQGGSVSSAQGQGEIWPALGEERGVTPIAPPTYPPLSVLQPNLAWKPPQAPQPTLLPAASISKQASVASDEGAAAAGTSTAPAQTNGDTATTGSAQ